jgi:adenylyl cyclase-associated protein
MKSAVIPFAASCEDAGLAKVGELFVKAMDGMRTVIVLASRSKPPSEDLPMALQPQLVATQKAVQELRELKLERNHDRHFKAVSEMLTCLSWVFYKAPAQPPAAFVKETLGSVEFWTNRIRKDCKDDPPQMVFCDNLRKVNTELVDYITEYHKQGLTFNPRGVSLAEAAILLADQAVTTDEATSSTLRSPVQKRHPTLGSVVAGPNMAGLMGELAKRQTQDGSSAATGLKHVRKNPGIVYICIPPCILCRSQSYH